MNSKLNSLELNEIKWINEINNYIEITINWMLSVNIEALNPPYKVYTSELTITIKAVIHKVVPEI